MTLSRRQLLTGSAGLLVAGILSQILPSYRVFALPPRASAITPSPLFHQVSIRITGLETPDGLLAQRLYSWIYEHIPSLDSQLEQLDPWLAEHSSSTDDQRLSLVQSLPATLHDLYQALVSGWYLGVVGPLPRPQCIGFENIVSYQLVKEYLSPPSYAPGQPNFWTALPTRREHV